MRAVVYEAFGQPMSLQNVPDPTPAAHGVVLQVRATGLCRSDWHGWMGHDPMIALPHVPGHELAGEIVARGSQVTRWQLGERVTLPFVCGCGTCPQCVSGNHQVCDQQFQPGFTHWGSFAEYVAIEYADVNLVRLPEAVSDATAASLGCRFVTAFRAIIDQGKVSAGQWVAIHGCGGVGLSATMIAHAVGANVVAIDIAPEKLALAQTLGAVATINARNTPDVAAAVQEITGGGAHVSVDALGSPTTCFNSIASLRKRGRHVQVGLLVGDQRHPTVPMDLVIANELEIVGSHGIQAYRYEQVLAMIAAGLLQPERLIGATISLDAAPAALVGLGDFASTGITVVTEF